MAALHRQRRSTCVALALAATLLLSACGGSGSSGTETSGGGTTSGRSTSAGSTGAQSGEAGGAGQKPLPPDAPISAVLARQFPKPKVQPEAPPGAQKAIDAGRKACQGKTPKQVRDEFIAKAEASGLLNPGQKKMIAEISHYESQAADSPDFVAGQLAAGVYEATLPETLRIAGYQGCVYELAQQLEKEIAKK